MAEFGFRLSYGCSKTATILQFRGSGAIAARQKCERELPHGIPVVTEHLPVQYIPQVHHYKHLGGFIVRTGTVHQDIGAKLAKAQANLRPLRRFLRDDSIPVECRSTIVRTMGLSILTLHAGTWANLSRQDYTAWQGAIWHLYQMLNSFATDTPAHVDWYPAAAAMQGPLPTELLFIARLRVFAQILSSLDEWLLDAIQLNWKLAQSGSWLAALQTSLQWLKEQLGCEILPPCFDALTEPVEWQSCGEHVRTLKKAIRHAQRAHLLRIQDFLALREQQRCQNNQLEALGWSPPLPAAEDQPVDQSVVCGICEMEFNSPASLAVHAMKKHGERIAMRRFAVDPTRRICKRFYTTRARLLRHLHMGTTTCWIEHCRRFIPTSVEHAAQLDSADRANNEAMHSHGLVDHAKDRAWRYATEVELIPTLRCIFQPVRFGSPTSEELDHWRQFGVLPTGQGGRPKTAP